MPVAVQYWGLPKPPSAIRPLGGCDVVMAPFGPDRKVLHGSDAETTRSRATMPLTRTRLIAVGLAVALLAGACGGGEDSDPAERGDEAGSGASVTSEDERLQDAPSGTSEATPADEMQEAAQPAAATPVRLGERFGWCSGVQALWDAQDQARAETEAAAVAHGAAVRVDAYEAATDDLDRASNSTVRLTPN